MQAFYKDKDITYDIDTRTYSDNFSTTFWQDFTIAENFGKDAIRDTYKRAIDEWSNDVRYYTDLVMTLNHKIWQHYGKDEELAELYNELWQKADDRAFEIFEDEDIDYYIGILD